MTHLSRRINTRHAHSRISVRPGRPDNAPTAASREAPDPNERVAFHAFDHFRRQLLAHVLACYAHGIDRELLDAEVDGAVNALQALRDLHA